MAACEGVDEGVGPLVSELFVDKVEFRLSASTVLLKLAAYFIFYFFVLEVGLAIEVFGLNEAVEFVFWTLQQNHISWKSLVLFDPHNIPNMNILPGHLLETSLPQHFSLGIIDFPIRVFPFDILKQILDGGDSDNHGKWYKDNRKASWVSDGRDHLHDANNKKIDIG